MDPLPSFARRPTVKVQPQFWFKTVTLWICLALHIVIITPLVLLWISTKELLLFSITWSVECKNEMLNWRKKIDREVIKQYIVQAMAKSNDLSLILTSANLKDDLPTDSSFHVTGLCLDENNRDQFLTRANWWLSEFGYELVIRECFQHNGNCLGSRLHFVKRGFFSLKIGRLIACFGLAIGLLFWTFLLYTLYHVSTA